MHKNRAEESQTMEGHFLRFCGREGEAGRGPVMGSLVKKIEKNRTNRDVSLNFIIRCYF